jgi:hypothetical protein
MVLQAMQVVQVVQETTVALVELAAQVIMEILVALAELETMVVLAELVVLETTVLSAIQEMLAVQVEQVDLHSQFQQFPVLSQL